MDEQYLNDIVRAILRDPTASDRAKLIVDVVSRSHSVDGVSRMIEDYHLTKTEIEDCACLAAARCNNESYLAMVEAGAACNPEDVKTVMRVASEQDRPAIVKAMVLRGMRLNEDLVELYCSPEEDPI